jgi:hypothetical protein
MVGRGGGRGTGARARMVKPAVVAGCMLFNWLVMNGVVRLALTDDDIWSAAWVIFDLISICSASSFILAATSPPDYPPSPTDDNGDAVAMTGGHSVLEGDGGWRQPGARSAWVAEKNHAGVAQDLEAGAGCGRRRVEEGAVAGGQRRRMCAVCEREKPLRTHHCRHCARCVYLYDHHCTWLNNCIGAGNLRFFFQYLVVNCCGGLYSLYLIAGRHPDVFRRISTRYLMAEASATAGDTRPPARYLNETGVHSASGTGVALGAGVRGGGGAGQRGGGVGAGRGVEEGWAEAGGGGGGMGGSASDLARVVALIYCTVLFVACAAVSALRLLRLWQVCKRALNLPKRALLHPKIDLLTA